MTDYDVFSPFYDAVMGDRAKSANLVRGYIKKHHPKAKSILELATGTGSVLQHLSKYYSVSGIDLSAGMLKIAKNKVPSGKFYKQNMTKFKLPHKVDVIICVFDSINHLTSFSDWQKVFNAAYKHLEDKGLFIFDMNTSVKLEKVATDSAYVKNFGKNTMIMDVIKNKSIYDWGVKVFENVGKDNYKLHEEHIKEVTFPVNKLLPALNKFSSVIIEPSSKQKLSVADRVQFICKK